jgi:hypothetical protein
MEKEILEYANQWFKLHGIPTFIDDGSMYVQVSDGFELQLSTSEISYRAQLFLESEKQKTL